MEVYVLIKTSELKPVEGFMLPSPYGVYSSYAKAAQERDDFAERGDEFVIATVKVDAPPRRVVLEDLKC